jgi:hypothetical protein
VQLSACGIYAASAGKIFRNYMHQIMPNRAAHILSLVLLLKCVAFSEAKPIKIVGEGQVLLLNVLDGTQDVIETASLIIVVDGPLYRISSESVGGGQNIRDEFGSDGVDTFLLSDRPGPFNRDGKGWSGFAFPGRLPRDCTSIIQAAWLGYCSESYFNGSTNLIGLKLNHELLCWSLPENVTNLVTFKPGAILPQSIKGWSRNLVKLDRNSAAPPIELKQYEGGFKAWVFAASNNVTNGSMIFPRQITLEAFAPKPPKNATTGEDTQPIRKVVFTAHSIEVETNSFDPLPPVPVAGLSIIDSRFDGTVDKYLVISKAGSNGWPTHSSKGFEQAATDANQIALDHDIGIKTKSKRSQTAAIAILGVNLMVAIAWMARSASKKKPRNQ